MVSHESHVRVWMSSWAHRDEAKYFFCPPILLIMVNVILIGTLQTEGLKLS